MLFNYIINYSECWKNDGIVTEGCQPYTLEEGGTSAQCSKTCVSGTVL